MKWDFLSVARYEVFIVVGLLMAIGTFLKLTGYYYVNSDWFWFLAGVGLAIEGSIELAKQQQFQRKYKVISREEYERLIRKK